MTKIVGVFRLNFPEVSETFIRAQLGSYQRYKPRVYAKRLLAESVWPVNAVSDHGKWAERLYLATRSPRWHTRGAGAKPQLIHAHFGVDGVYALPLARRLGIPLITTFHGFDILTRPGWWLRHPTLPAAIYLSHLHELRKYGACFVAVSRFIETALIDAGFPRGRIVQHYIGVDTTQFTPKPSKRNPSNRYILSVGRHVGFKGIDTLLKAFARITQNHPEVKLLQVGAGPETPNLVELAHQLGLGNRVQFMGAMPSARVIELLQGAEVFALPSRTQSSGRAEALGIVFNEASACGIPIVATRSGGIPEVVLDEQTGLLCAENDAVALAHNLDRLLADAGLRDQLGGAGRALVCEAFNLHKQTTKLEQVYDDVLS